MALVGVNAIGEVVAPPLGKFVDELKIGCRSSQNSLCFCTLFSIGCEFINSCGP